MKRNCTTRRDFMKTTAAGLAALALPNYASAALRASSEKPNIVVIFCDDLGYGDLGAFGHPTIRTPNLDKMAQEGQRWTNFYAAASVCTPSRAALMTGRLPIRSGMCSNKRRVLFPDSAGGIPEKEITLAEALKKQGYTTACVGKWHLGHLPQYLPTNNGFDSYFGIPYSNDMDRVPGGEYHEVCKNPEIALFQVPLLRNEEVVEKPADQTTITKRYTEETVKFIKKNKRNPFFVYLAHSMPHVPLFRSKKFVDKSLRGIYGDVIEEIDWSVGQVLQTLKKEGLDKKTMVVFTSDNGPWLVFEQHGGSAGLLRGGKGETFDGGMREPTIFWWPGKIKHGVVTDVGSTMDIFTTACKLAGGDIPRDRIIDGVDIRPALFGTGPSPRKVLFYYRGEDVYAIRKGAFKAHFYTKSAYGADKTVTKHYPPLLYNLEHDPSEKYDIAEKHPGIIEDIKKELEKHNEKLVKGENQLTKRIEE